MNICARTLIFFNRFVMTCSFKIKKNLNFLFLRHVDPFVRMLHSYYTYRIIILYIVGYSTEIISQKTLPCTPPPFPKGSRVGKLFLHDSSASLKKKNIPQRNIRFFRRFSDWKDQTMYFCVFLLNLSHNFPPHDRHLSSTF